MHHLAFLLHLYRACRKLVHQRWLTICLHLYHFSRNIVYHTHFILSSLDHPAVWCHSNHRVYGNDLVAVVEAGAAEAKNSTIW